MSPFLRYPRLSSPNITVRASSYSSGRASPRRTATAPGTRGHRGWANLRKEPRTTGSPTMSYQTQPKDEAKIPTTDQRRTRQPASMPILSLSAAPSQPKATLLATPALPPPHPSRSEPVEAVAAARLRLLQPHCKLKKRSHSALGMLACFESFSFDFPEPGRESTGLVVARRETLQALRCGEGAPAAGERPGRIARRQMRH